MGKRIAVFIKTTAVLVNAGYEIVEAKNGEKAIENLMRERPDLVLLDANLPDMSGLEVCARIRLTFEGPIYHAERFAALSRTRNLRL